VIFARYPPTTAFLYTATVFGEVKLENGSAMQNAGWCRPNV